MDSHSKFIKVSQDVKVVNLSELVKDLRSKDVPASKVIKVVKPRGQAAAQARRLSRRGS